MNKIISVIIALIVFISIPSQAYAQIPSGIGFAPDVRRPNWKKQYEYIVENSCAAIAITPYNGDILYNCPNGERFWADVLTPIPNAPVSTYIKNKSKKDSDDATTDAAVASSVASINFN
jgi:hypothetical protein